MELTHDAQKLLKALYNEYKRRRNSGMSKREAKLFQVGWEKHLFPDEDQDDVFDSFRELLKMFNFQSCLDNTFMLNDEAIAYMEAVPIKKAEKIIDTVSKLKSLKP